jgi:hypothetical protein
MIGELGRSSPSTEVFRDALNNEISESTELFMSALLALSESTLGLCWALTELVPLVLDRDRLFRALLEVTRPATVPPTRPITNKIVRSILITLHSSKWDIGEGFAYTNIAEGLTLTVSLRLVDGGDLFSAPGAEDYEKAQLSSFA